MQTYGGNNYELRPDGESVVPTPLHTSSHIPQQQQEDHREMDEDTFMDYPLSRSVDVRQHADPCASLGQGDELSGVVPVSSGDYPSPPSKHDHAAVVINADSSSNVAATEGEVDSLRQDATLGKDACDIQPAIDTVRTFFLRVRRMSAKQLIWIAILVFLVMVGNFMQILMLNFWLVSFPEDATAGNYTAFAVPGILFSLFFVIVLFVYMVVKRPNLRFAKHFYGWSLLIGIGFCDTFNSWLATYAASYTSEVLQALFTNLCPLYAVFMSKWILDDPRRYFNGWIISVFVLTIAGILAASLYGMIKDHHMEDGKVWIFIFFLSIPFRVLMNVWQSLYMIVYTKDHSFAEWLRHRLHRQSKPQDARPSDTEPAAEDDVESNAGCLFIVPTPSPPLTGVESATTATAAAAAVAVSASLSPADQANSIQGCRPYAAADDNTQQEIVTIRYHQGDDMIVKLMMLAGETFFQMCFTLALLPADALPWWGNSDTVEDTWHNFVEGIVCVFTIKDNFIYGFLYTLGFVFTYIGCAYLNHYSVGLCSIVSQLSSPLTALILVLVPSWNVMEGGDSPWYCSLIAIVLLSIAALAYVIWEEITDDEKVEGERVLKMNKLRVRPLEPATTVIDATGTS